MSYGRFEEFVLQERPEEFLDIPDEPMREVQEPLVKQVIVLRCLQCGELNDEFAMECAHSSEEI